MMSVRTRFLSLTFAAILLARLFSFSPLAEPSAPSVSAHSAVLIDAEYGTVLYAKDADTKHPMASTTKVMTALVALEQMAPDTQICISPEAIGTEGSSIYLVEGEQLTLEQLLYALLLESANDAAVAIAVGVAGSVEQFAELMNRKAADLGLTDTQFQNPHGLDAEGHYTTAYELALIARAALQNELILKMVSTRKTTIPHGGIDGVRLLVNHNKMLRLYEGSIGVKTGYTKKSGRCLISAAERDGVRLIAVTLNASDDWNDHTALLDYGFSLRESVSLCEVNGIVLTVPVVGGEKDSVIVSNPQALCSSLPKNHPEIRQTIELPRFLFAPVGDGEEVGQAVFRCDLDGDGKAEIIGETPITVQCGVRQAAPPKKTFWQWICSLFGK